MRPNNNEHKGLGALPTYTPDPKVWDNVEKHLDEDKKRRRAIIWWSSGIAASLLLVVGSWIFLNQNKMSDPNMGVQPGPIAMSGEDTSIQTPVSIEDQIKATTKPDTSQKQQPEEGEVQTITFTDSVRVDFNNFSNISNIGAVNSNSYTWGFGDGTIGANFTAPRHDYIPPSNYGYMGAGTYSVQLSTQDVAWGRFSGNEKYQLTITDVNGADIDDVDADGVGEFFNKKENPSDDRVDNTEEYAPLVENIFESPSKEPLSTFAIDVDNASYSIMRTKIRNGEVVPKNSVRIEEYVNYFNYDYKKPEGDDPFSVNTEIASCPWNEENLLVHIGLQGRQIDYSKQEPCNLVFLIDVSGSMDEENKLSLVKKSMKLLTDELSSKDRVGIVTYAGAPGIALEATSCDQKEKIKRRIEQMDAGGSTAGGAAIEMAYKMAKENFIEEGNNRVILCTDGDFNVGANSDSAMKALIESYRDEGIFITVCGFGMGNYKDSKMETIADHGNGNYFYIDNFKESEKVFSRELRSTLFTIAKDVKIQVEFNPRYVKSYRLIGYENRIMPPQDFDDDTKDAGELGAGHTVTALYEIVPTRSREGGSDQVDLRYQENGKLVDAYNDEIMNVRLRYKTPRGTESTLVNYPVLMTSRKYTEASENFRFSAGVTAFGLILRGSEYRGDASFGMARTLVNLSLGEDPEGDRAELLELILQAENIYNTSTQNMH